MQARTFPADRPPLTAPSGNKVILASLVCLSLAGCGNNVVDRTVSGGLIGAGSGAVVGATVGNPAAGAVIGGVAGAVTGAVTTGTGPNLGKPIWR